MRTRLGGFLIGVIKIFESAPLCPCVVGRVVPDISTDRMAVILKIETVQGISNYCTLHIKAPPPTETSSTTRRTIQHHSPHGVIIPTILLSPFQLKFIIFLPLQPGKVAVTALMCLGSYSAVCSSNFVYVYRLTCG
jgi:hypothetical protein